MVEQVTYRGKNMTISRSADYVDVKGPEFEFEVRIYNNENNNLVAELPNKSSTSDKELVRGSLQRYFDQHVVFKEESQ